MQVAGDGVEIAMAGEGVGIRSGDNAEATTQRRQHRGDNADRPSIRENGMLYAVITQQFALGECTACSLNREAPRWMR